MKRILNTLLSVFLVVGISGCSKSDATNNQPDSSTESITEEEAEKKDVATQEEDLIDDPSWETLNSLGMVKTENGLFYVSITLPAELVGEDITQESIDSSAGNTYTSGKLNEDGSVTYKMTKKQHKAMLDTLAQSIDDSLQEMINGGNFSVSAINPNADYTSFDVQLTTEEVGINESFMVMALYMYGGMYSIFTGNKSDIIVNYYSASGELIHTANSADAGN